MSPFEIALRAVLAVEGGTSVDPRDRGNWTGGQIGQGQLRGTKYGISAMAYPALDVQALTIDQAAAIYRRDYWDAVGADGIPAPLDALVFDCAVNQGPGAALRLLQQAVGVTPDGVLGPKTREAMAAATPAQAARFCALRIMRYTQTPTWPEYGAGWSARIFHVLLNSVL